MGTYKRKTVEINSFTHDLAAIKKALIGDEYQSEGLIARLAQIEARLGKLERLLGTCTLYVDRAFAGGRWRTL